MGVSISFPCGLVVLEGLGPSCIGCRMPDTQHIMPKPVLVQKTLIFLTSFDNERERDIYIYIDITSTYVYIYIGLKKCGACLNF